MGNTVSHWRLFSRNHSNYKKAIHVFQIISCNQGAQFETTRFRQSDYLTADEVFAVPGSYTNFRVSDYSFKN